MSGDQISGGANYWNDKRGNLLKDIYEKSPELPSVLQKLVDEKQLKYKPCTLRFITKYDVWVVP